MLRDIPGPGIGLLFYVYTVLSQTIVLLFCVGTGDRTALWVDLFVLERRNGTVVLVGQNPNWTVSHLYQWVKRNTVQVEIMSRTTVSVIPLSNWNRIPLIPLGHTGTIGHCPTGTMFQLSLYRKNRRPSPREGAPIDNLILTLRLTLTLTLVVTKP